MKSKASVLALAFAAAAAIGRAQDPYAISKSDYSVSKDGGLAVPSGYLTIKDEATPLTARSILTFLGSSVTCVDNAGNFATECTFTTGSGYNLVMEEGSGLTARATLNFIGSAITCADNAGATRTDCTLVIPTSYATVDDEGTPLTQRTVLDFAGAGVTCADSGGVKTLCTIPGAGGSTPTGTGFRHVTAGVEDGATKLVDTADINASQVTNAKLANMATVTVKSNITGGAAAPSDNTVTGVLDTIGSARGSLLVRGAATWGATAVGTAGQRVYSDGTDATWQDSPVALTKELSLINDWSTGQETSTTSGSDLPGYTVTNANGGTAGCVAGTNSVPAVNHPGIQCFNISTSASSSSIVYARQFASFGGSDYIGNLIRIPVISDGTDTFTTRVGWGNNATTAAPTHGCWFEQNSGVNSGNWTLNCNNNNGGVTTTNSSSAPVNATWYLLEIVNNAGSTSVDFRINGASVGTVASGIPTSTSAFFGPMLQIIRTAGTTNARQLQVDYTKIRIPVTR